MKGFFGWASGTLSAIASFVSEAPSQVYNVVANTTEKIVFVAQHLFFSPFIFDSAYEMARQSLHAIRDFINPATAQTIYQSSRTRALLMSSVTMNAAILFLVLVQQELERTTDGKDRDALESIRNLYMFGIASTLLNLFLKRIKFHNAIDKTANVWSIAHVVTTEHPNNNNFVACKCAIFSRGKSFIQYPVSVMGRAAQVWFISWILGRYGLGKYTLPVNALNEGQNLWIYKLDSAGICSKHQQKLFNANNMYFFMWGLVFTLATQYVSNKLMEDNDAVYAAVYNLLYPFFVISTLTVTQSLPNKGEGGTDFFEAGRESLKFIIKKVLMFIDMCMKSSQDGVAFKKITQTIANMPPIVKAIFLDRNLHSIDNFVTRREVNRYIALCGDDMRKTIATVKRCVSLPAGYVIPAVTRHLPHFIRDSETIDKVARAAFNNEWRPLLRGMDAKIVHALEYAEAQEKNQRLLSYQKENLFDDWEDIPYGEKEAETRSQSAQTKERPSSLKLNDNDSYVLRKKMQEVQVLDDYSPNKSPNKQKTPEKEDNQGKDMAIASDKTAQPAEKKAAVMRDEFNREWELLPDDSEEEEESSCAANTLGRDSLFAHKVQFVPQTDATIQSSYANSREL